MKDFIKYFITDNKSGHKTREKWLMSNNKEVYDEIINFSIDELSDIPFKHKVWHFINKVDNIPECECGTKLKFKKSLKEGYGSYCSIQCTNKSKNHINSVKQTNIKKYGGVSPSHSMEVRNKIKETNLEKYGVENLFSDIDYIKEKTFEKHGVNHISKLPSVKNKIQETNLNKYGVISPLLVNKNRIKGYDKKKSDFILKYKELDIIDISNDDIIIKCGLCKNNYSINRSVLYHRYQITTNPCTICHPKKNGVSIIESELIEFIESLTKNLSIFLTYNLEIY